MLLSLDAVIFCTSAFTEHVKTNDHQTALLVPELKADLQAINQKCVSDQEKGALIGLKSAYWLASEGLPLAKFQSLINFLKEVNVPDVKHLSVSDNVQYESPYAATEFLKAMSQTIDNNVTKKLSDSPYISVLADESTDICVNKRLVIYAQLYSPISMRPATHFLTNVQLHEGTGKAIAVELQKHLHARGISFDKVLGLGSDGAAVMTGRGKGTTGYLLRANPHLMNVHCIAHRLALCTSQAAEKIPPLKDYQEIITSIFYYFKYSTNRVSNMREVQKILESPVLKYKEVHSVRWLSFYSALETVYRTLDPLLCYLTDATDAKAAGLKKKIATVKFVSLTHILMDIIPVVSKLNLFFQKENVDVALVKVNIDHCIDHLGKLKTSKGQHELQLESLLTRTEFSTELNGHKVTGCPQRDIDSAKVKFIDSLISNIADRFPDTDLLSAFGVLGMRPISMVSKDDLLTWGDDKMDILISHFGQEQTHTWKDDDGAQQTKSSPPLIDPDVTRAEWSDIKPKVIAQMYPRDDFTALWSFLVQFHKHEFPNLIKLAQLAMICPIHTSGCERGFSAQNSIFTPVRNRLSCDSQEHLMRIKIEGGGISHFDFQAALNEWKKRSRKLFTAN